MGAFLNKPVTDTFPFDDRNEKYAYGSSSMQGYRISQEDAHMCLLDFDNDTCLFGVFDGHGGAEVAQYASKKFPEFLKSNKWYQNQDYEKALREAFMEFDASLVREDVCRELKILAGDNMSSEEEEEDMPSNLAALKEEANLPIQDLLKRFAADLKQKTKSKLETQKSIDENSSSNEQCPASSSKQDDKSMEPCSSSKLENGESNKEEVSSTLTDENEVGCSSSTSLDNVEDQPSSSNEQQAASKPEPSSTDQAESSSDKEEKEKRRIKPTQIAKSVSFLQMLDEIDDEEESDDDSMMEDEGDSDDSEMFDDSDESDEEDESESDELDDEDEEENDATNGVDNRKPLNLLRKYDEGPGRDSGCTAVIALIKNNRMYVANAGDSRAVLCRAGKAIEMSEDHKPTSEIEYSRIKKAGGKVTQDGRVNGGLNLSRAFGDHSYKINTKLPQEEQMITALPDVRIIDLQPEDEFIVIACDGIWNSMNSDEVVEYITEEMKKEKTLSKICDSLFFKCLAEDTRGDGSGCDNQTCIIIKLKDLPEKTSNNGEVKMENVTKEENANSKNEIKIVNHKNVESNGKRKHDETANVTNGNDLVTESPLSKKTKSESE